jgi:hypothetical protein
LSVARQHLHFDVDDEVCHARIVERHEGVTLTPRLDISPTERLPDDSITAGVPAGEGTNERKRCVVIALLVILLLLALLFGGLGLFVAKVFLAGLLIALLLALLGGVAVGRGRRV